MRGGSDAEEVLYGQHSRSGKEVSRLDRMGNGLSDAEIIKLPTIRMIQDVAGEDDSRVINCAKLKALIEIEHDEGTAVEVITCLLADGRYSVDTGLSDQSLDYYVEDRQGLEAQVQIYYEDQEHLFGDLDRDLIYH